MSSAICFSLDQSKILLSGNGLIKQTYHKRIVNGGSVFSRSIVVFFTEYLISYNYFIPER